jgi:division protein CdvB (Snf7/Vps24/ESCRT-III family)
LTWDKVIEPDRQALEDLVVDYPELERLEALPDELNIFEEVGNEKKKLDWKI